MDARDRQFYGGLVIAAVGGLWLSPPWTLVAVGAVLVGHALFAGLFVRSGR